ncbi:hypothetical protein CMI48_02590 [Candidatus Pacearchaeota archaeon]|jgi:hypothetical protein|nr:hypothetical protein [Candidatus Pacearchaeota archaeon]|tara:strand:+ start:508 stop:714 length:207 start_codon:yes stop_codon:yes gene_type:complete
MKKGILLFIIILILVVGVIHYNNQAQEEVRAQGTEIDENAEVTASDLSTLETDDEVFDAIDSILETLP